jgi:glycerol-3-phosphate dehydrogenase (NAD(P)+)
MSKIIVAGAGAFGTALALTQLRTGRDVTLVGRNTDQIARTRTNPRLPGFSLPKILKITDQLVTTPDDILLLCIPMQQLDTYLADKKLAPKAAIACCKGIDLASGRGPAVILSDHIDAPAIGVLTGPSFATDLANGLPTALTLALPSGASIQQNLATDTLRLYLSDDITGAELGGALKNVIAIACGICIGAELGESARAALMTQSRNFRFGQALGANKTAPDATTEGRATAIATVKLAARHGIDMPIASAVARVVEGSITLRDALDQLLSRPLTKE